MLQGFGKMRIQNQSDFEDFRSVCALQDRYVTTEPFIGNYYFILIITLNLMLINLYFYYYFSIF